MPMTGHEDQRRLARKKYKAEKEKERTTTLQRVDLTVGYEASEPPNKCPMDMVFQNFQFLGQELAETDCASLPPRPS